jgi:hypothetical protein
MEFKPHFFLGENLKSKVGDEVILFDKFLLKRPDQSQKSFLKIFIEKNYGILTSNSPFINYKYEVDDPLKSSPKPIDNFWIVEHPYERIPWFVDPILSLSSLNLTVLLEWRVLKDGTVYVSIDSLLSKVFYHDYEKLKDHSLVIDKPYLEELRSIESIFKNYLSCTSNPLEFKKTLDDFISLKEISVDSPFRFLCYFSILESLLTHNKQRSASNTTIAFQLQTKLNLLNNRFENPIDYRSYFKVPDTVNFELIIEKLYHYRSDIAHGNVSDFDKDLFILKGKVGAALKFIHAVTRNVILLTLKEPDLVKDLKNC